MPRFKFKAKDRKIYDKIFSAFDNTEILQRQRKMEFGRWDFAVFGPSGKDKIILRKGFAEQATIQRAPVYIASLADPEVHNISGVPIEEFVASDLPEEYMGLEIVQIDPLRPLTIENKEEISKSSSAESAICKRFEDVNIAVIRAPEDSDWGISVLRYLHECDSMMSDSVIETFNYRQNSVFPGSEYRRNKGMIN